MRVLLGVFAILWLAGCSLGTDPCVSNVAPYADELAGDLQFTKEQLVTLERTSPDTRNALAQLLTATRSNVAFYPIDSCFDADRAAFLATLDAMIEGDLVTARTRLTDVEQRFVKYQP